MNDEANHPLLHDAEAELESVFKATKQLHKVASNSKKDLDERIEAYEDILIQEVGDTDLVRARNIERETGLRQVYLKFEGGNPTGTQKDRIAFAQTLDALRRGFEAITVATCGNYGVAVSMAARLAGLEAVIFIPEKYHTKRMGEMEKLGAKILRTKGGYEEAVIESQKFAEEKEIYDANPGGANTHIQIKAYGEIAYEIYDELRDAPWAIAAPVSNGTTLAGIYRGFVSLYRRGKTSRIPKIVAGSSLRKNPIVQAFLAGSDSCHDLAPGKIKETKINEPLINWHSIDGDVALNAIRETEGWAVGVTDKSMLNYARMIRQQQGLDILPASSVGLPAMLDKYKKGEMPNDRFVIVITGRKS